MSKVIELTDETGISYIRKQFVLWKNPKPDEIMESGYKIELSTDDYDYYEVFFNPYGTTSFNILESTKSKKGHGFVLSSLIYTSSRMAVGRGFDYVNDMEFFGGPCWYVGKTTEGKDNTACIPVLIIGYK